MFNRMRPIVEDAGNKIVAFTQTDVPNYAVSSAASLLFLTSSAISALEQGRVSTYFNLLLGLTSGAMAVRQYGVQKAAQSAVNCVSAFFKRPQTMEEMLVGETPAPKVKKMS